MEENKTLFLVLPENWHFLRGDMKGWGFKCKLSNYRHLGQGHTGVYYNKSNFARKTEVSHEYHSLSMFI